MLMPGKELMCGRVHRNCGGWRLSTRWRDDIKTLTGFDMHHATNNERPRTRIEWTNIVHHAAAMAGERTTTMNCLINLNEISDSMCSPSSTNLTVCGKMPCHLSILIVQNSSVVKWLIKKPHVTL